MLSNESRRKSTMTERQPGKQNSHATNIPQKKQVYYLCGISYLLDGIKTLITNMENPSKRIIGS